MEVVHYETPHALKKQKDVAMEEVEDVQAHGVDESNDEMKICNLANTI